MTRKSLIQNYISKAPSLLDDFSSAAGWTAATADTIITEVTDKVKTGTKSLKIETTSTTGGWAKADKIFTTPISFTSDKARNMFFRFFYPTTSTQNGGITLYFSPSATDGDWTRYISFLWTPGGITNNNWCQFSFNPRSPFITNQGNVSWDEPFRKIRIAVLPKTGYTTSIIADGLFWDGKGRPRVAITFDDGWLSQYENAFPVMQQYGFPGTAYVVPSFFEKTNYVNETQIQELANAGWLIANHTQLHKGFVRDYASNVSTYIEQVRDCNDWLNANGYHAGTRHHAYPYGEHDEYLMDAMRDEGFLACRAVRWAGEVMLDGLNMASLPLLMDGNTYNSGDRGVNLTKNALDSGSSVIMVFHRIVPDESIDPGISWTVAKFQQLMQYLSDIKADVVTMDEWYQGLYHPRRRVMR